jgi:hypothetical protein
MVMVGFLHILEGRKEETMFSLVLLVLVLLVLPRAKTQHSREEGGPPTPPTWAV